MMGQMRNRRLAGVLFVAPLAIATAGCSSSATSTSSTATATTATATSTTTITTPAPPTTGTAVTTDPTAASAPTTSMPTESTAPAAALPDPCSLVTTDEVAAFLGGTVTATPGAEHCVFDNGAKTVTVTVGQNPEAVSGPVSADAFAKEQTNFSGAPLDGIGDAAYLAKPNSFIAFRVGTLEVVVEYGTVLISDDDVASLTTLARAAAGRA
ncbi:MAG: hypothetical protein JWM34_664 [Ilumatobacteraceae bacterium]|nr:hypothetical protein [Ilumatobacteraceae bacterium]